MRKNHIRYFRFSFERRGRSGLDLEAKKAAVESSMAEKGAYARRPASMLRGQPT